MTPTEIKLFIQKCAEQKIPDRITLNVLMKEAGLVELPKYLTKESRLNIFGQVTNPGFWQSIGGFLKNTLSAAASKGGNVAKYYVSHPYNSTAAALSVPTIIAATPAILEAGGAVTDLAQKMRGTYGTPPPNGTIPPPSTEKKPEEGFDTYGAAGAGIGSLLGLGLGPSLFGSADPMGARLLGLSSGALGGAIAGNLVKNLTRNS